MVLCLLEEMRRCTSKPVSYDKIKEVAQEPYENPALFYACLVDALCKYTNVDPTTQEGCVVKETHFISQSVSDIHRKLQKLVMGPQPPTTQLSHCFQHLYHLRQVK